MVFRYFHPETHQISCNASLPHESLDKLQNHPTSSENTGCDDACTAVNVIIEAKAITAMWGGEGFRGVRGRKKK